MVSRLKSVSERIAVHIWRQASASGEWRRGYIFATFSAFAMIPKPWSSRFALLVNPSRHFGLRQTRLRHLRCIWATRLFKKVCAVTPSGKSTLYADLARICHVRTSRMVHCRGRLPRWVDDLCTRRKGCLSGVQRLHPNGLGRRPNPLSREHACGQPCGGRRPMPGCPSLWRAPCPRHIGQ